MDASTPKQLDQGTDKAAVLTPTGMWGTILTTTPIVLTVLATAFAGLSSSEMTQSMYYRSLASQHQSKAGDQWSFFQAKRIRGSGLDMTVQLLQTLAHPSAFEPSQLDARFTQLLERLQKLAATEAIGKVKKIQEKLTALLTGEKTRASLPYLLGPTLPEVEMRRLPKPDDQEAIDAVVQAIRRRQTEAQTKDLVARINPDAVEEATRLAEEDADRFDKASESINDTIQQLRALFVELSGVVQPVREPGLDHILDELNANFRTAALDYDARRYQQEALYNRHAAELYEVQVRRCALASDRHRERSKKFFYSMLLAQAGVTISSLAVAGAKRSLLWLCAALAGVAALVFSSYVYLLS